MATHIDTNTWKMDQKTSYLKLNINSSPNLRLRFAFVSNLV